MLKYNLKKANDLVTLMDKKEQILRITLLQRERQTVRCLDEIASSFVSKVR
jgi:hypothetical protein